jgi:integrase
VVVLAGLAERARLEVLYGVQCRALAERRTTPEVVQMVVNLLQAQQAASVLELSIDNIGDEGRLLVVFIRDRLALAMASPETEAVKDVWDLRVFGRAGGRMHFAQISQPWLAAGAKQWAFERLDTAGAGHLERIVQALGAFSASLRRHRPDRGIDPVLLARADVLAFSNDLAHLETAGRLSRDGRRVLVREVAQFLREARGMGLSGAGGPLAGLHNDVVLQPSDRVRGRPVDPEDDQARALPQVVVDQLLASAALAALEAKHGVDARTMVELQAQVGRRTGELCQLSWDCLSFDEVLDERGQIRSAPVQVHDMPKVFLQRYRLPIDQDAAEIIGAQQARVQERFPHTDTSLLALFPMVVKNSRGTKACSADLFGSHFRTWIDSLASLVGPGGEPYDRSELTVYSFRHTYAQRHADGVDPVRRTA